LKDINFGDIPVLTGLDRINLARLIPNFEKVEVKSGEIIFKQGEPGDSLYIIVDGIVIPSYKQL
jgi:CRP-like cAMP-binding protein